MVTAGPTREFFDPVRFLSNPSSGKMGYALAEAARKAGARVTLISGPATLPRPKGTRYLLVTTAEEMYRAVMREARFADIILMAAAVCDWRPVRYIPRKVKKKGNRISLRLVRTPDILKELGRRKKPGQILVGFAAETDHLIPNALKKLKEKNLDLIVANLVGRQDGGFARDENRAVLLSAKRPPFRLAQMSKRELSSKILNFIKANR